MKQVEFKKVNILGLGYIGLPTAALIASKGLKVIGVDIKEDVVGKINKGQVHIIEPDLKGLVRYVVEKGYLKASIKPEKADVFIIAVPTPFKENHQPDISYVEDAIRMILPFLEKGNLVIIESTSPVGTTEKMKKIIFNERVDLKEKIYIAYCPERVLPGQVIYELEHNDRAVGGINPESAKKSKEFYSIFVKGNIYETNSKTAEMCKLVENAYRDVNIAFANELSMIADNAGVNVWELIELANKHPRVNILDPGPGVGGHCIAVDPWFIISQYPKKSKIIKTAREINDYKSEWVMEQIKNEVRKIKEKNKKEPIIGLLGVTYKPNIDDLRESPALQIALKLKKEGFNIIINEPNISLPEIKGIKNEDLELVCNKCDIISILVSNSIYKDINWDNYPCKVLRFVK